jgi:hypothetical protein
MFSKRVEMKKIHMVNIRQPIRPARLLSSCPEYIEPALPLEIERARATIIPPLPMEEPTTGARVTACCCSSSKTYLEQEPALPPHPRVSTDAGR